MKIEVYTRSMNSKLYSLSSAVIDLPYKRRRILYTTADDYFYFSIMKSKADVFLNIGQDAFVTDNDWLKRLIEYVLDNNYINCGMPDGGVVDI